MNEELDALHKNNTWDMVDLRPGQSVVGCRWVFKIKTKADGSVERYKTCLVAITPFDILSSFMLI